MEKCFDILVDSLKQEPAATQCVFSCQMGRGRTTLGTIFFRALKGWSHELDIFF
jgi:hypothetical protein